MHVRTPTHPSNHQAQPPPPPPSPRSFAAHNTHEPLEAPEAVLDQFAFIYDNCTAALGLPAVSGKNSCSSVLARGRRGGGGAAAADDAADASGPLEGLVKQCCFRQYYSAMAHYVDGHVGQVVAALKAKGMWANTLLVLSADNGGPIYRNGAAGGNNWPHRGGKKSNFEGGVRVNALAAGGLIPPAQVGTTTTAWMGTEDWYTTFCALAGVSPEDHVAAAAGLPPVDGVNLWPLLSGANSTPPRTEVWLGSAGAGNVDNSKEPIIQALIRADGYKLIHGLVNQDAWTGPFYPNATTSWCDTCTLDCGPIDAPTCLFNVLDDPTEHNELSAQHPDIVASMAARLQELAKTVFAPDRGKEDTTNACHAGDVTWGGFVGPFLPGY